MTAETQHLSLTASQQECFDQMFDKFDAFAEILDSERRQRSNTLMRMTVLFNEIHLLREENKRLQRQIRELTNGTPKT